MKKIQYFTRDKKKKQRQVGVIKIISHMYSHLYSLFPYFLLWSVMIWSYDFCSDTTLRYWNSSTSSHRGRYQNPEPRGRVISDFTGIIQVQLLQQPQQQQQRGHRKDNIHWKFKGNNLDEAVCVLVNSTRIIWRRKMEGEAKRDVDGEGFLGELLSPQLRSR